MTISPQDVHAYSLGSGAGDVPLPAAEADRIAAVLNQNVTHRPAPEPGAPAPAEGTPADAAPGS